MLRLVFFVLALGSVPLPRAERPADADAAFLLVRAADIDDLWAFVEAWEKEGARFPHVYPPDVLIGRVPARVEDAMRADARLVRVYRKGGAPGLEPSGKEMDRVGLLAASWFAERRAEDLPELPATGRPAEPLVIPPLAFDKSSPPLPDLEGKTYGRAFGANYIQTSEWMLGKVAVGVVLPDCPGNTYSRADIASVLESVRGALDFWASRVDVIPYVRFVYDVRSGVRTDMDFMNRPPRIDEEVWVPEILGKLGYESRIGGDPTGAVYDYVDSLRTGYRSEWGICFIIPKVPAFRSSYDAYSHFGGPFVCAPAGVLKDEGRLVGGTVWLSHLLIKQTGHLFWALDESCFSGSCVPCHVRSGYLNIYNKNSMNRDYYCAPHHVPCAMETPAAHLCEYTLAQAGVADADDDLIPDVLDTHPIVAADTLPDTVGTISPLLTGLAYERPLYNWCSSSGIGAHEAAETVFPRNHVTFNSIEHVVYRIDGVVDEDGQDLWMYADPEGGWGRDTTLVRFAFHPDSLTGGNRTITIRAINTVGNRSSGGEAVIRVFVKAIALRDFTALPDYEGTVRVSFRVRGETFGALANLYRSTAGGEETLIRTFPLRPNTAEAIADPGAVPGASVRYRLEVSALGSTWNHETSVVSPAPIRRGEHISRITPNPFRERTVITYDVPRGGATNIPGGEGSKPPPPSLPPQGTEGALQAGQSTLGKYKIVRVEIDIFNLAGRLVRAFPDVHSYEGIYATPVIWDGTDDAGRRLPPGVYFVRLRAGDVWETRKVLLLP